MGLNKSDLSVTDLGRLQQDFSQALFNVNAKTDLEVASQFVQDQDGLTAIQRVGIYRNSVHGILSQHLAAVYPVCQQLIGGERFSLLCDVFIDHQSPDTPYLAEFGRAFADFLKHYDALKDLGWVVDIARLEWARHAAWHKANQAPANFAQLAQFDEHQQAALCFSLPESAQLLHFLVAADEIWSAHQLADTQLISAQLANIQLQNETYLIIWRRGRTLEQTRLSKPQWQFLQAIQQGATLEALSSEFEAEVATLLATAVQQGWVYSFI